MDREVTSSATFEASAESNDVVPKLPAKNERENDVVLGILFNVQCMAVKKSGVHKRLHLLCKIR